MRFVMLLLVFLIPSIAFGQTIEAETTILPPAPPPPSTNWEGLVAAGAFYVFAGVTAWKQTLPWFKGWKVPLIVVPVVSLVVALYQVGFADLKLLAKHAGILFATAYGGTVGLRKLARWALDAWNAYRAGTPIADPPSMSPPGTQAAVEAAPESKATKAPRMPSLPVIMTFSLLALGCGATNPCAVAYKKAADCPECTGDEIRARVAEVDQSCAYQLEGGSR